MASKISKNQFLQAFSDQWDQEVAIDKEEISEKYNGSAIKWTNFMLAPDGFIDNVVNRINKNLQRKPEWWRIDLVYTSRDSSGTDSQGFNLDLQLLVEHENGDFPEEEMYNLIFFRSPLKVIIFRDYNDDDRGRKTKYGKWLQNKLNEFSEMLKTANAFHSEDQGTQYLFIIWARRNETGPVYWRWATDQSEPLEWRNDT